MEVQLDTPIRAALRRRAGFLPQSWGRLVAAAVVVTVAAAAGASTWQAEVAMQRQLVAQQREIDELRKELADRPNWPAIVLVVERSVATVETDDALGSAWVAHTDAQGSELITNYHVIEGAWKNGIATVTVRLGDRTLVGTIERIDPNDDLAVVHVSERLPALASVTARPKIGSGVMAVGSPLGLDGTVTVGVVSAFRSLEGSEYMQFSAPVSPGNSGGPVIDEHGNVVGVTSAKLVYTGAEGLSLAIPVQVACLYLVTCTNAPRT
jgi:putative serine protease PepD